MVKACFKCGSEKSLDQFYKHPRMLDGYLNKCKECTKKDVKILYAKNAQDINYRNKEKVRGRDKYYRLYQGVKTKKEVKARAMENYKQMYPEKVRAKSLSSDLKSNPGFNNHHWSYNDIHARDVIEIEISNHAKLHRYLVYDKKNKMYRTMEGTLLDTKEKHIEYMNLILKIF